MKPFLPCLLLLLSLCPGTTTWAGNASTNEPLPEVRLAVDMTDGSNILGVPAIESVTVQTAYAKLAIPLKLLLTARLDARTNATLNLRSGEILKGALDLPPLKLEAVFDRVVVQLSQIRKVTVVLATELTTGADADTLLRAAMQLHYRAYQLQAQGNKEAADTMYEETAERFAKFLTLYPSHPQVPKTLLLAGKYQLRVKDYPAAIQLFERLLHDHPHSNSEIVVEAMYWCGEAYLRDNKPTQAYRMFKKMTWDFPSGGWSRYARDRLSDPAFKNTPGAE